LTLRERICEIARRIPRGRVTTYGDLARMAGAPRSAREAGRTIASLPDDTDVPWWRVVNRLGEISPRACGMEEQAKRLATEGVRPGKDGRINLDRYRWEGPED
jgi:methylated-DNA-protein-cysteine methyltransferase related protein